MLLVGVWANRNWILGNWLKEARVRSRKNFEIRWIPFIYAKKRPIEKYFRVRLPKRNSYFFSYPTIFEHYLDQNPDRFRGKSIVLYPHNEDEMGTLVHQAEILNQAFKTYFFCNSDAEQLVAHGLMVEKTELAYCAVDDDCVLDAQEIKSPRTVILASKFGPRKGLDLLPDIVRTMTDFRFIALGRGWEEFIQKNSLCGVQNFEHHSFNKENRNKYFSQAGIFLSLSKLEGGPVPLIEAMAMGCVPVATRTGFAPDLVDHGVSGILLSNPPDLEEVRAGLLSASQITVEPKLGFLTWDRITQLMIRDKSAIQSIKGSTLNI